MNIDLYTAATPNGYKVSIALEELGLKYNVIKIDLSKETQKEEWFLKLNPNGRIPVLKYGKDVIFESGAILIYLANKHKKLIPINKKKKDGEFGCVPFVFFFWIFVCFNTVS